MMVWSHSPRSSTAFRMRPTPFRMQPTTATVSFSKAIVYALFLRPGSFSLCAAVFLCLSLPLRSQGQKESTPFSHELLNRVLVAFVDSSGGVDYAGLKEARRDLDLYLDSLASVDPRNHPGRFPTPQHALAYWLNAYNAFVLTGVIDSFPVASVMDIEGGEFFDSRRFLAGEDTLSLNELENQIVRPQYRDPRVHFALNCGATSCPALGGRAFSGDDLDARLDAARDRFLAGPYVRIDRDESTVYVTKIMEWFGGDFTSWLTESAEGAVRDPGKPSITDYLVLYLPDDDAAYLRGHPQVKVVFEEYDWALNSRLK